MGKLTALFFAISALAASQANAGDYVKNIMQNWKYVGEISSAAVDEYTNDARVAAVLAKECYPNIVQAVIYDPSTGRLFIVKKTGKNLRWGEIHDIASYFTERHLRVEYLAGYDLERDKVTSWTRISDDFGGRSRYFLLRETNGNLANVKSKIGDVSGLCHRR